MHAGQQHLLVLGDALPVRQKILQHRPDFTSEVARRLVTEFQQLAVVGLVVMLMAFNGRPRVLHRRHIDLEPKVQRCLLDHPGQAANAVRLLRTG